MSTTPLGSQPAAIQVEAAMGISTFLVAEFDMKVVMTVVTMANTKSTISPLGFPPRILNKNRPISPPPPDLPKEPPQKSLPLPKYGGLRSWQSPLPFTDMDLAKMSTTMAMAGMIYMSCQAWIEQQGYEYQHEHDVDHIFLELRKLLFSFCFFALSLGSIKCSLLGHQLVAEEAVYRAEQAGYDGYLEEIKGTAGAVPDQLPCPRRKRCW